MNSKQIFDSKITEASQKYEAEWHKRYPQGTHVTGYCNSDVPGVCFTDGAKVGREVMMEWVYSKLREVNDPESVFYLYDKYKKDFSE